MYQFNLALVDGTVSEVSLRRARGRKVKELAQGRQFWKSFHQIMVRSTENSEERINLT